MIRPRWRWHSRWLQYDPPLPGASPATFVGKRVNGWTRWRYHELPGKYIPVLLVRTHTQFSMFHVWIYILPIIIGSQIIWKCWSHISFKTMCLCRVQWLGGPSKCGWCYHWILHLAQVVKSNKVPSIRYTPWKLTWTAKIPILARQNSSKSSLLGSRC